MALFGRFGFLIIAVVFHLIYAYSIFDIYFVSPIVHGMKEHGVARPSGSEAPAKRLVLIVGDGLRADKAFQSFPDPSPAQEDSPQALEPRPLAPFLRSRVLSHGTFGVSHTRVPTESRPGHVALIAGLYEDVSAVMTGWKLNPVNFDSVFNRSSHTWSWGSPDILPMFKEGAAPGRVDAETYGEEAEDFTQDATQLDTWVFEKVRDLFASAGKNATLNAQLRQDKTVFFLHLLGLDTTGHAYRPYSKEYLHNIKVVDEGTRQITELIDNFYSDDKTAYVFTADHGMSDWGSHGDGHPDNTRTPLIAWGSGVAKPALVKSPEVASGHEDGFSADWDLSQVARHDVAQADVAALMAYLAGLEFPVNSVGEIPLSYIAGDAAEKASAAFANVKGILEMYKVKEKQKMQTEIRYRPYAPLGDERHSVEQRFDTIQQLIDAKKYEEAIEKCKELTQLGLQGLRYLQTYDWLFLRTIVTAGYLGWIAFALTSVIDLHVLNGLAKPDRTIASSSAFASVFVALAAIMAIRRSPWNYYAYGLFPVVFWEEVFARRTALKEGKKVLFGSLSASSWVSFGGMAYAYLVVLVALVQGYFHREIFSICFIAAAFWPAYYGQSFVLQNKFLIGAWASLCALMSLFTLLPVVKAESLSLILLGGVLILCIGLTYLVFEEKISSSSRTAKITSAEPSKLNISRMVTGVQVGLVALSILVTISAVQHLQAKKGLPLGTQTVGWLVLVASLTVPFLHGLQPNNYYLHRLMVLFLTFSPSYIILTISYESLFYLAFCLTLLCWVMLEHRIYENSQSQASPQRGRPPQIAQNNSKAQVPDTPEAPGHDLSEYRPLTLSDARIALFFLFLLQSAFFSTGNIASISSFSLDSVYRLIPVFDPFSQGALLLFKIMTPFAIISANLGILNRRIHVAPSALFMVVMAITDVMTLNFFYMVRDEGSWLDIGTTISHFVIASGLCVFVAGLEAVSELFVNGVEVRSSTDKDQPAGNGTMVKAPSVNGSSGSSKGELKDKEHLT